jgi:hypothetical protein
MVHAVLPRVLLIYTYDSCRFSFCVRSCWTESRETWVIAMVVISTSPHFACTICGLVQLHVNSCLRRCLQLPINCSLGSTTGYFTKFSFSGWLFTSDMLIIFHFCSCVCVCRISQQCIRQSWGTKQPGKLSVSASRWLIANWVGIAGYSLAKNQ